MIPLAKRYHTITELSEVFDTTPRTLRYYEELGLLAPERRGSRRLFTDRDRVRLRLILRGRRLGFSLGEIREMLDLYDADRSEAVQLREVLRKGRRRIDEVTSQIADLRALLAELKDREAELERLLDRKTPRHGEGDPS